MKRLVTLILMGLLFAVSCVQKEDPFSDAPGKNPFPSRDDTGEVQFSDAMILLSLGFNNLASDLDKNIEELCSGDIPNKWEDKAVFVFSHTTSKYRDYTTHTDPVLYRVYASEGKVVKDTLAVFSGGKRSADASTIREALTLIKHEYLASHYGIVFSSHSSAWIPAGYSTSWEFDFWNAPRHGAGGPKPFIRTQPVPTKSMGVESTSSSASGYQIELADFAKAIPMHLDYLIFDCCLTGSVEVAYQMRNVADWIAASPTETLTYGHVYPTLPHNLLYTADRLEGLKKTCQEYFDRYNSLSGQEKSATIALYDCRQLEPLAAACAPLFEKYRTEIAGIARKDVQDYNYNYDEFYDLRDILAHTPATEAELSKVDEVLGRMVAYKAATEYFIFTSSKIDSERYSGISMYLPYSSRKKLNEAYSLLDWNRDTQLLSQ